MSTCGITPASVEEVVEPEDTREDKISPSVGDTKDTVRPSADISEQIGSRSTLRRRPCSEALNIYSSEEEEGTRLPPPTRPVPPPPTLLDLDTEMDKRSLTSPPSSLTSMELSGSDDLTSPAEEIVLEPSTLLMENQASPVPPRNTTGGTGFEPDEEVLRALDEMAASAEEMEQMSDWGDNWRNEGRSVTEMEQGTVAQNIAISLPDMKENGNRRQEVAVKRPWVFYEPDMVTVFKDSMAEFTGTFFLILICVGSANSYVLRDLGTTAPAYYLAISCAFGFGIGGIVHVLAATSGGHVNPAVTWALLLDGRMSGVRALFYTVAQFLGGFAGAGVLYGLAWRTLDPGVVGGRIEQAGLNQYSEYTSTGQAFVMETFGTLFLTLTVLSTIHERRGHAPSYLQPLAIGISILVTHIWLIPHTNCGINPVRGTVWNIVNGQASYQSLVFLFAPYMGSSLALLLFHLFLKPR